MSEAEAVNLPVNNVALVEGRGNIFYAEAAATHRGPFSALVKLVQGVYRLEPIWARATLRNRIHTNYPLPSMCEGMVRVAAKRATAHAPLNFMQTFGAKEELINNLKFSAVSDLDFTTANESLVNIRVPLISERTINPEFWMNAAAQAANRIAKQKTRHLSNRPIACFLVSAQGEMLGFGANNNAINKTLHAEVNMVQAYYLKTRALIPEGAKVFITLKPCIMCASMIWYCAEKPESLEVIYRDEDVGGFSRQTIFDSRGRQRRFV